MLLNFELLMTLYHTRVWSRWTTMSQWKILISLFYNFTKHNCQCVSASLHSAVMKTKMWSLKGQIHSSWWIHPCRKWWEFANIASRIRIRIFEETGGGMFLFILYKWLALSFRSFVSSCSCLNLISIWSFSFVLSLTCYFRSSHLMTDL